MNFENKENNNNHIDQKKLLEELAKDIASEFGIKKEQAENLIKSESRESRDELRNEISKLNQNKEISISEEKIDNLADTIAGAKEVIEKTSKIEIKNLKEDIDRFKDIENNKSKLEKYLPSNLVNAAKNPRKPHEHILGFALGTANSTYKTAEFLLKVGMGAIKAPYHLYLIISKKGEYSPKRKI